LFHIVVSNSGEDKVRVYVYCKHMRCSDKDELKNLQYKADKVRVCIVPDYVELEYNISDKTDEEILKMVEHDVGLIESYFEKYERVLQLVERIKKRLCIVDTKFCPVSRQPCIKSCRFYDPIYDRCTFNIVYE